MTENNQPKMNMKYLSCFIIAIICSLLVSCGINKSEEVTLLYWNIQNGMWSDQPRNYDTFVEYVKGYDPDICVWCEAQSIYHSGTDKVMPKEDRYLVDGWGELASRYGHNYWYIGGYRDSYPQVITSKYPIEGIKQIVGNEPDSVVTHGSGWAKIEINGKSLNIVTTHTWPQKYAFRTTDIEKSKSENGGDAYRLMEMDFICKSTINSVEDGEIEFWMMLGDFNSRSRVDNSVYNYPEDDSRFWVHDYIQENTPYLDLIHEFHPDEFCKTMPGNSRIDFVYCTEPLFDCITDAYVIVDEYTEPVRDSLKLSNFYYPSDHRPILVKMEL